MKRLIITILTITALSGTPSIGAEAVTGIACAPKKDSKDSITTILEKAKNGDAVAQNTVGIWYYTGMNAKKDYNEALQWWARSAKQDNLDAIGNMAMCYQYGNGTKKDSLMAVKLYKAAIQKGSKSVIPQHEAVAKNTGSLFSCRLLYECYKKGLGVKRNESKADMYLTKIAVSGDVDSQFSLALKCLNNKCAKEAAEWFKLASAKGHFQSTYYYGYLLFNGMGVAQDKAAGVSLMEKAADGGMTAAHWQLGQIYYHGNGIEKDYKTAVAHLKAAAADNKNAAWLLGLCYKDGTGADKDYHFAAQWIAEAAHSHVKELNALFAEGKDGAFYNYILGLQKYYVDKNYEAAASLFKTVLKAKAAEGGTMLALCLADKNNKKRNAKKAIKCLEQAIEEGSVAACYYLSDMCATGEGLKQADKTRAIELLTKAANGGVASAQCLMGDKYYNGVDVPRDFSHAAEYYIAAEAQNHLTPASAANLIGCYERGITALPDISNAKQRIAELRNMKPNTNLADMLKDIKEDNGE